MNNTPRISVAMCCYNGRRFLKEQLDSIFSQTVPPDEIVLLDDCSTDRTVPLAGELLEKSGIPFHILQNEENCGVKRSFQKAILACKGEFIFTADQDDLWRKDKIEKMTAEFEADPDCVLVFSNGRLVDAEGRDLGVDVWSSLNLRRAGLCDHVSQEQYRRILTYTWAVPGTQMAFRRSLAEKAFPVPKQKGYIHDSWLAICAPLYGTVRAMDEELTLYRQHGGNTVGASAVKRNKKEEDLLQLQKVLFYLKRHADRLQLFLDTKEKEMPDGFSKELRDVISLYRSMQHYESDGKLKKSLFLLGRILDGKLSAFDIRRGDVLSYLFSLPSRPSRPPRK